MLTGIFTRAKVQRVIQWSIVPILVMNGYYYFMFYVVTADMCTGTGSGVPGIQNSLICNGLGGMFIGVDIAFVNVPIPLLWVFADRPKYPILIRLVLLLYIFPFRYRLAEWMRVTVTSS